MSTTTVSSPAVTRPALHRVLWGVQVVLALVFAFVGASKLFGDMDMIRARMPWTEIMQDAVIRGIGAVELLGAAGLILPSLVRVAPRLTALAAAGLALTMVLAAGLHASRNELGAVPINVALGLAAAFVAWGRWRAARISPRRA
jgi:putative oxidoreductase